MLNNQNQKNWMLGIEGPYTINMNSKRRKRMRQRRIMKYGVEILITSLLLAVFMILLVMFGDYYWTHTTW